MSDDEMPEDEVVGPSELPKGVAKLIVKEADAGNWKKPKTGDEVTVHYVGSLESDGSEFDSSRSRGEPFKFTLGQGQVIKGWDLGVATMKMGELAKFTLTAEYAYGESGSPPKIPANANLIFEVELLSWVSKDDLFQDGGVIKSIIKEGSGWKRPKEGDEVKVSMRVTNKSGSTIDEKNEFEYVLGSGALGLVSKAVDKALTEMKKDEKAQLICTKKYASEDGTVIELSLDQLYETKDVSFMKDRSIVKKTVVEGEGFETPIDRTRVTLSVEAATDGDVALPGFTPKVLQFVVGSGEVCDALECAAVGMQKGEKAILTCTSPVLANEEQLGLKGIAAPKVLLTLEMQEFRKAKDAYVMSEEDRVALGNERKEVGSRLFREGRILLALERYKHVTDIFDDVDNFLNQDWKDKAKELKSVCEVNKAACQLKMDDYFAAKASCNNALEENAQNIKALFRRAQADFGLKNFSECMSGLKRVIDLDPQNKEARALYKRAQTGQKEDNEKSKGLFSKMCGGLVQVPTPCQAATGSPQSGG